jgi:hypothetical protein
VGPSAYPPGDAAYEPDDFERTIVQPLPQPAPAPPPVYAPYGPPAAGPRRGWALPALVAGIGGVIVVVLAVALIAPRTTPTDAGPSTVVSADATPETTMALTAGRSRETPAPVGTESSPAKGWTLKVTGAETDADAIMKKASVFSKPGRGKQFVLVSFTAANQGTKPASLLEVKLSMLTADGSAHGSSWNATPDRLDTLTQVQPGGTVSGKLAYELPKASIASAVVLAEPVFTVDHNEDQRFFAIS